MTYGATTNQVYHGSGVAKSRLENNSIAFLSIGSARITFSSDSTIFVCMVFQRQSTKKYPSSLTLNKLMLILNEVAWGGSSAIFQVFEQFLARFAESQSL